MNRKKVVRKARQGEASADALEADERGVVLGANCGSLAGSASRTGWIREEVGAACGGTRVG